MVSRDNGVPLVAFTLKDHSHLDKFQVSDMPRRFRWIVPAYTMLPDVQHVTVLRVVIREDFSHTLVERLVLDIQKVVHELDWLPAMVGIRTTITVTGEDGVKNNGKVVVAKKSALETRGEITNAWKKFVMDRKKMNGVC